MSEAKKCPECGREMEKGYVNTNSTVFWDTKVHKGFFGTAMGGDEVIAPTWGVENLEGYRCLNCKLILFKYGKKTELPPPT